jgi:hypothetical protein
MIELLNAGSFKNIKLTNSIPEDGYKKNYENIVEMPIRGSLTIENISNMIFYSDEPSYSFRCMVYLKLKENILLIIGSIISISYITIKVSNYIRYWKENRIARNIYNDILEELRTLDSRSS